MPPSIVIERGESLDKWALRIKPDFTTILQVLTHVCTRLQLLHENGLAHRDLKPGNILWRPKHLQWTLIDFGCAAPIGACASLLLALFFTIRSRTSGLTFRPLQACVASMLGPAVVAAKFCVISQQAITECIFVLICMR